MAFVGKENSTLIVMIYVLMLSMISQAFDLTILHTNDVRSRIQEINKYGGACSDEDSQANKCFGGMARLRTMVNQKRTQYHSQTLLLSGGSWYQGTLWFYRFGGSVIATFMNLIGYDAMCLGNHEFDQGPNAIAPLIMSANFPILSSNADFSRVPTLASIVKKSVTLDVAGKKIGIVGYTTAETASISKPGNVTFSPELSTVQAEVDRLRRQGVNKIIALGHAGFDKDVNMAMKLKGLDVIVGGLTKTFLYTGEPPSNDKPVDKYPKVVTNIHGETVLVVQDFAYGKYLGELHVTFNDAGKVTNYSGNPLLLDGSVQRDPDILGMVKNYLPELDELSQQVIGHTFVLLNQRDVICQIRECSAGNLVADAFVQQNLRGSNSRYWSDIAVAVVNAGSMRASLEPGNITVGDAVMVQPFRNSVGIVVLLGETVKEMFEYGASSWSKNPQKAYNGFLQVSGLRLVYDMGKPTKERVVQVLVRCHDCLVPEFKPLDMTKEYPILMSSFIAAGGDGYSMIPTKAIRKQIFSGQDSDILVKYITAETSLYQGLEGRIRLLNEKDPFSLPCSVNRTHKVSADNSYVLVLLLLLVTVADLQ